MKTPLRPSNRPTKPQPSTERAARAAASRREAEHDATLIQRFNGGDESAFNELVERYREKVFSVALALLRNRHDAEEIAQDTFIRVHRGLCRFRGEASFATWIHRITVNLSRNRYWYFYRRRRHDTLSLDCPLSDETDSNFADLVPSESPTPDREAASDEFSVLVETCMEKLDARHREILTLRNSLNRSYDEIAQALGINVGTVKSRIARARGNLRALMAEACPEFSAHADPADWFEPQRPVAAQITAA